MSRIKSAFNNGKALITFITGGDPNIEVTQDLILAIERAGADIIEIGIPFSDPAADGPVIQLANERGLKSATNTDSIFDMIVKVKAKSKIPLVLLTYYNIVYKYGKDRFLEKCNKVGIDGIIVADLPYEEREEILPTCNKYNIDLIPLIAPTSKDRIKMIAKEAKGFVYCVSSLGVTGVRSNITTDIKAMVDSVKSVSDIPCAIGFGIATKEQAKELAPYADGIIIGSAIVDIIAKYGEKSPEQVYQYVKKIKNAIKN